MSKLENRVKRLYELSDSHYEDARKLQKMGDENAAHTYREIARAYKHAARIMTEDQ